MITIQHHHPTLTTPLFNSFHREINLMKWNCQIPGKEGTIWEGGLYPLTLQFTEDYPAKPPKCSFPQHFFHPNVYPSGAICLSIVNENEGWRPNITVKQILLGIQELLNNPNPNSPAQSDPYIMYTKDIKKYEKYVKAQAARYPLNI